MKNTKSSMKKTKMDEKTKEEYEKYINIIKTKGKEEGEVPETTDDTEYEQAVIKGYEIFTNNYKGKHLPSIDKWVIIQKGVSEVIDGGKRRKQKRRTKKKSRKAKKKTKRSRK